MGFSPGSDARDAAAPTPPHGARRSGRAVLRAEIAAALDLSLRSVAAPKVPPGTRPLSADEVLALRDAGCTAFDWSRVSTGRFSDLGGVTSCRFTGEVVLALAPGSILSSSGVTDCILEGMVVLERTGLLAGYHVLDGAVIEDCGRVVFESSLGLARGPLLKLGVETGERDLRALPAIGVPLASRLTSGDVTVKDHDHYEASRESFASFVEAQPGGVIGRGAHIRGALLVENCLVGDGCRFDCPGSLRDSIFLGGDGEGCRVSDGSIVRSSVVQWSASVDCLAMVEDSVVCERARVEKGARLTSSMLGPCSSHGSGEVTASLVGPLCAMHHQSLLIAARWPDGGGNLGYGANVGSNHTSRLPDQEISIGGGVFFGLGSSVKFPAFVATGTIIATGVTLPPGRIAYPFSLVTQGEPPAPAGAPALLPGWVLYDNLFSLLRNASKHRSRFDARRSHPPACLTSSETALQAHRARAALSAVPKEADFYTSADLPGAGACTVSDKARLKGIEGYTLYLRWLGFSNLLPRLERGKRIPTADEFEMNGHLCALPELEFPGESERSLMERYLELIGDMKQSVSESRMRDYRRGASVIPDYADRHAQPSDDEILAGIIAELDSEALRIARWLRRP